MNYFKTGLLLAGMTGLFMAVGFFLGGQTGMVIAFVVALGMNAFAYWNSDKAVLRMHNARQVSQSEEPEFYGLIAELTQRADMPMPKVFLIDSAQPNAFATGRNPDHAAVAATRGLLDMLSREEIAGVMAHELGHVRNRDTLIMTVTATIAGAIGMLAQFGFYFGRGRSEGNALGGIASLAMMILAPMAAMVVQMAISRTREYSADRAGAEISGNPGALASALHKISNAARGIPMESAERNPATGQLFIINPLSGQKMDNLFSTHPDTENRIAALKDISKEMGISPVSQSSSQRRYRSSVPRTGRRS